MKLSLFLLGLASASAFAPANVGDKATTALNMAAPEPIGALPPVGFLGKPVWDAMTTFGSEDTGTFIRAMELKHGRSAMLATTGFLMHESGLTLDKISPHEYLSVTQGVKFADLAAMTPIEAWKNIPAGGLWQIFLAISIVEIYEMTHKDGKFFTLDDGLVPGLQPGGLTGDLGWNPLKFEVTDELRLKELQNGRAAMIAICAWMFKETLPGSVPIPLPW